MLAPTMYRHLLSLSFYKLKVEGVGKTLSTAKGNSEKRQGTCHYCKEPEHYKRECKELAQAQLKRKPKSGGHSANEAAE